MTLVSVDGGVNPDLAAMALDISRRKLNFARVLLLSSRRPELLPPGIEWIQIPALDYCGYNLFVLRDLWRYVHTSHVLLIETDGFVLNPERWDSAWLEYDYIGAPWIAHLAHARRNQVGNSGFCLRSRRLLHAVSELATDGILAASRRIWRRYLNDVIICYNLHQPLTSRGFRFAPAAVAAKFAVEKPTPHGRQLTSFGYHGRDRRPTQLLVDEFPAWSARTRFRQAGGRLRWLINVFRHPDAARYAELEQCYCVNSELDAIDDVLTWPPPVSGEPRVSLGEPWASAQGYTDGLTPAARLDPTRRPTFAELVNFANATAGPEHITCLANSDIVATDAIRHAQNLQADEFWALTRWEPTDAGYVPWRVPWSQDVWVWRGRLRIPPEQLDFPLGSVGCDSRLAFLAHAAGYRVSNPALTVRTEHVHRSPVVSQLARIPAPYLYVQPHRFGESPQLQVVTQTPACATAARFAA